MSCCGVFIMPHEMTQPAMPGVKQANPITGRFVLLACVAFFGVIFAVNAVMMTLAIRTMPGLDVKNGYVASQARNGEISAMRQQMERGWQADVTMQLQNRSAPLNVRLTDKTGAPVSGLDVKARLAHPAFTRADHMMAMIETGPGNYSAAWSDIHPGAWTIVLEADRRGNRVFASRNRVVLTETRP
jgi:nitrogen fixation protein FixH